MRALAKRPAERYASMVELSQALQTTPEGLLALQASAALVGLREGGFVPATPAHPTAPEFGVASGTGVPLKTAAAGRDAATRAHGSAETPEFRAETPLVTEADASPKAARSGARRVFLLLAALGSAGALAALMLIRSADSNGTKAADSVSQMPAKAPKAAEAAGETARTAPAVAPLSSAVPIASAAPVIPERQSGVRLEVTTDPAGATLSKNGFQVCDATPCEVLASPNETLELSAVKGRLRGQVKVLAQRDQKVRMALIQPGKPAKSASAGSRMCEVEVDGLKILRPCP
jgi:hypothetical protein